MGPELEARLDRGLPPPGAGARAQNQRLPEAEKQFRAMHELAARWVESEPESVAARDLLASSYCRLGRVLGAATTPPPPARVIVRPSSLRRRSLARQPKNLEYKFHLALAVIDSAIFALDRQEILRGAAVARAVRAALRGARRRRSRGPGEPGLARPHPLPVRTTRARRRPLRESRG